MAATDDTSWSIPTEIVPDVPLRREEVNEDRFRTYTPGITPVMYYEDGKEVMYKGDLLDLVRQHPEERGASNLISRLITRMMADQTAEDRAAHDPTKKIDMAKACARDSDGDESVSSFIYQDFLKRYMRWRTPERGVLVYHGLGSGKTAASIGMIESCLDTRKIVIILPASLKDNYRRQLEKFAPAFFGNGYHGGHYHWRFREVSAREVPAVSEKMGIPADIITENGGVFELDKDDSKGGTSRPSMAHEIRLKLDKQIIGTIFSKITMYSSNGFASRVSAESRKTVRDRLYVEDIDLDNAVVVCDEFHRIISMRRNLSPVGIALYNKIRDAKNSKIVALSGTPIVNAPFEIALIANMLHGRQMLYVFPVTYSEKRKISEQVDDAVTKDVLADPIVRFAQIRPSSLRGGGNELVIIKHPKGFRSVYDSEGQYSGVVYEPGWAGHGKDDNWEMPFAKRLSDKGIVILKKATDIRIEHTEWLPEQEDLFLEMYTTGNTDNGDDIIRRREELSRRLLGKVSYYRGADLNLLPDAPSIEVVRVPMSEEQFGTYSKMRMEEIRRERLQRQRGGNDDDFGARVITRPICNMVFPESIERPTLQSIRVELGEKTINSKAVIEAYAEKSRIAIQALREFPPLNDPDDAVRAGNLAKYSPKMMAIVNRIRESPGLALIYSNYLHMEGLDSMAVFLEKFGYRPLTLVYESEESDGASTGKSSASGEIRRRIRANKAARSGRVDDSMTIRIQGMMHTEPGSEERRAFISAPKYIVYSGEIDELKRSLLVSIYRGEISRLPKVLRDDVAELIASDGTEALSEDIGTSNLHGEIAKVMMITAAGAEGLDLRAIRQVHIVEPYWNRAREQQVFGRAVRICSHALLPESERNVQRFIYLSTFAPGQLTLDGGASALSTQDGGETTDEYIYNLATRKQRVVDAFLRLMRSVAVDCSLHARKNAMLPSECYVAPRGDVRELTTPSFYDDKDDLREIKSRRLRGLIDIEAHIVYIDDKGVEHPRGETIVVYDPETRIGYELDPLITGYVSPIGRMERSRDGVDRIVLDRDMKHAGSGSGTSTTGDSNVFVYRREPFVLEPGITEMNDAVTHMMEAVLWDAIPRCVNTDGHAIFAIGHPGSGKSTLWRTVHNRIRADIGVDNFVVIDPDMFLFHNPFYMEHVKERVNNPNPDGTITLNPDVIEHPVIRKMIRDGVDRLFEICYKNRYSFVYESLWRDPAYYIPEIYQPVKDTFTSTHVYIFYNPDYDDLTKGIHARSRSSGRYVSDEFSRSVWEMYTERVSREDGREGEYITTWKDPRNKPDAFLLVDTNSNIHDFTITDLQSSS